MVCRRPFVAQPDDGRGHQRVAELHIVGVEAMDVEQRHLVQQVLLDRSAVVHVHELAWNQPACQSARRHPRVAQAQEVTVETGEPARLHAGHQPHLVLEPRLVAARDVVVPHIRRVADHEVVGVRPRWRNRTGEILRMQHQPAALPELGGWRRIVPIYLVAYRRGYLARRKDRPQRGIEGPGADRGI